MFHFIDDEEGATAIEYGLIVSLMTIVLITGIAAFNAAMSEMYSSIDTTMNDAMGG